MIQLFPTLAMNNRRLINDDAGCFHCCQMFKKEEIKEYTDGDQTAICPRCGVDCVIPKGCGFDLTEEMLQKGKQFWFNTTGENPISSTPR